LVSLVVKLCISVSTYKMSLSVLFPFPTKISMFLTKKSLSSDWV
jgi:hypothetical protein